jgi:hypothetical protein
MRNEPAQVSITAASLEAAYSEDEAGTTAKYNGKVLQVTGVINNTSRRSSRGKLVVTLQGGGLGLSLTCYFLESEASTVTGLAQGLTVTVKGRNDTDNGFLIILRDCVVVESGAQRYVIGQESQQTRYEQTESTGCFIATATYENVDHPDVRLLRRFRDEALLLSALGKAFVRAYYLISPVLAACIRTEIVRSIIKNLVLRPVIFLVRKKLEPRSK